MRPSNQKNARLFAWIQENLDQFQQVDIVDEPTVDTPKVRLVVPAHTRDMVDAETQQCVEGAVELEYDAMVDSRSEAAQYQPKLYIVIPALNEEASIGDTLKSIEAAVECEHEIIVVNDHSIDRTAAVVHDFAREHGNVRLVDNEGRNGFSNALQVGYAAAGDGVIVTMMADLCDDPGTIPLMYEKILEGYDVVCGSRYMQEGGKEGEDSQVKGLLSRFVGLSLRRLVKVPTHDATNAFKMYRSEVIKSITIEEAGFACSMEITVKAFLKGCRIAEVPTTWRGRTAGKSKFSMIKGGKDYLRWYIWAVLLRKHTF